MKYILTIILFFMLGACDKEANHPTLIENSTFCERAYDFKHSTSDNLPVSCHVTDNRECCLWKLDSKTDYEMCLDEHCIWDPSG